MADASRPMSRWFSKAIRYGKDLALAVRSLRSCARCGPGVAGSRPGDVYRERIPQMPQTVALAWFDNLAVFSAWQREAQDFTGMSLIISSRLPVLVSSEM